MIWVLNKKLICLLKSRSAVVLIKSNLKNVMEKHDTCATQGGSTTSVKIKVLQAVDARTEG